MGRTRKVVTGLDDQADPGSGTKHKQFGQLRSLIVVIAAIVGAIYGLIDFGVVAADMFRFKGGIPAAKIAIAGAQGLLSGLAVWGLAAMFTLTVAPQRWLLHSKTGKEWMTRTGLKTKTNTLPLRIMTAIIGLVSAAWTILSVIVLFSLLMTKK